MKIKRYIDKDMRRVVQQVRADQGADAVILSTRRVEHGIELVVAIDYDESLARHAIASSTESPEPVTEVAATDDTLAENCIETVAAGKGDNDERDIVLAGNMDESESQSLRGEISSLRGMLESQVASLVWKDTERQSPVKAQILRNLARLAIAPDVAQKVLTDLGQAENVRRIWHTPLSAIARKIPIGEDDVLQDGGVIALVGPTGVGKTTTIAKIATRFAIEHGEDGIALVSADSYRIGARQHLAAFANIIGAKVYSAQSSEELSALLARLKGKRLVLIDTEGRSPRDRELSSRLAAHRAFKEQVRFYLTLSAASQEAAIDEAIHQFRKIPLAGCVLTKIDEAVQLGGAISSIIRNGLPVSWMSDGQRIPDDLHQAARKRLWLVNRLAACLDHYQPDIEEQSIARQYFTGAAANA